MRPLRQSTLAILNLGLASPVRYQLVGQAGADTDEQAPQAPLDFGAGEQEHAALINHRNELRSLSQTQLLSNRRRNHDSTFWSLLGIGVNVFARYVRRPEHLHLPPPAE
ncbi:MAG TPA: hypothetical protein VES36_06385 [Candidatus Limnocylindrales bacterium]|nr:hypothetical protein [Candidatus Limnocylindrales bacterium]